MFEKKPKPPQFELETKLKWSNYSEANQEIKVKLYIEYLLKLVYFKTLFLGGDISTTAITWFYPVSMDEGELQVLRRLWEEVYSKILNKKQTIKLSRPCPKALLLICFISQL